MGDYISDFKETCFKEGLTVDYSYLTREYYFRFSPEEWGDMVAVSVEDVTDFIVRDEVDLLLYRVKIELLFSDYDDP